LVEYHSLTMYINIDFFYKVIFSLEDGMSGINFFYELMKPGYVGEIV